MQRPIIKWGQDKKNIYIRIDIIPDQEDIVMIENDKFIFKNRKYNCELNLINPVSEKIKIAKSNYYQIKIPKTEEDKYWNNLVINPDKTWIRIDWDYWVDEDEFNLKEIAITIPDAVYSESEISFHSSSSED